MSMPSHPSHEAGPTIDFWYEFASTYAYLATVRIKDLAAAAGVTVRWRPFMLGPIFKAGGYSDSPFNLFPAKGRYMWRDMERLSSDYGVLFRRPSTFPRSGLLAARVAIQGQDRDWIGAFSRAVFEAEFGRDADIQSREIIEAILATLGLPVAALLAAAESSDVKAALHRQTEQAAALGIFGAPSFIVGEELFWGNDRLEQALRWAQEKWVVRNGS